MATTFDKKRNTDVLQNDPMILSSKENNVSPPHCHSQHICPEIYVPSLQQTLNPNVPLRPFTYQPHKGPHRTLEDKRRQICSRGRCMNHHFGTGCWHTHLYLKGNYKLQSVIITDSFLCPWRKKALIFSKFNLLNTDTPGPLIRILSMSPSMSV